MAVVIVQPVLADLNYDMTSWGAPAWEAYGIGIACVLAIFVLIGLIFRTADSMRDSRVRRAHDKGGHQS